MTKKKLTEDEKYSYLYTHDYGCSDSRGLRIDYIKQFLSFEGKTIVDLGCGRGHIRNLLNHAGYTGIDVASALGDIHKDWADNEIFINADLRWYEHKEQADISISFDVLEHIEECSIVDVLKQTIKAGKTSVIGISCRTAAQTSPDEDNLHRTVRSPRWWEQRIRKIAHISHIHIDEDQSYVLFIISDDGIIRSKPIPRVIGNMRIWIDAKGAAWIPRRSKIVEDILDIEMIRDGRNCRWFPRYQGVKIDFTDTVYIVGKGPSLDFLCKSDFKPGLSVICINDSIQRIKTFDLDNPLFMCQQDPQLNDRCKVDGVVKILNPFLCDLYAKEDNCHFIEPMSVGCNGQVNTGAFAIGVAKFFGVKKFKMLCFDACVIKKLGYADCIGYDPNFFGNDKPERFLNHRRYMDKLLQNTPTEWFIPIDRSCTAFDKPQE